MQSNDMQAKDERLIFRVGGGKWHVVTVDKFLQTCRMFKDIYVNNDGKLTVLTHPGSVKNVETRWVNAHNTPPLCRLCALPNNYSLVWRSLAAKFGIGQGQCQSTKGLAIMHTTGLCCACAKSASAAIKIIRLTSGSSVIEVCPECLQLSLDTVAKCPEGMTITITK